MKTGRPNFTADELASALAHAEVWAEGGYSAESRAYWQGMRDTLRVLTGRTTRTPGVSSDDPAALTLLGRREVLGGAAR